MTFSDTISISFNFFVPVGGWMFVNTKMVTNALELFVSTYKNIFVCQKKRIPYRQIIEGQEFYLLTLASLIGDIINS